MRSGGDLEVTNEATIISLPLLFPLKKEVSGRQRVTSQRKEKQKTSGSVPPGTFQDGITERRRTRKAVLGLQSWGLPRNRGSTETPLQTPILATKSEMLQTCLSE